MSVDLRQNPFNLAHTWSFGKRTLSIPSSSLSQSDACNNIIPVSGCWRAPSISQSLSDFCAAASLHCNFGLDRLRLRGIEWWCMAFRYVCWWEDKPCGRCQELSPLIYSSSCLFQGIWHNWTLRILFLNTMHYILSQTINSSLASTTYSQIYTIESGWFL